MPFIVIVHQFLLQFCAHKNTRMDKNSGTLCITTLLTLVSERGLGAGGRGDQVELGQLHVCKTIDIKLRMCSGSDPLHIRKNTQKSKFLLSQAFKWKKIRFFVIPEMPSKTFVMLYKKLSDPFKLNIFFLAKGENEKRGFRGKK